VNLSQEEAWGKMLSLLTEATELEQSEKANKLLEAIAFGIGILICKEERHGKRK